MGLGNFFKVNAGRIGSRVKSRWNQGEWKRKAWANKIAYKTGWRSAPKRYTGYRLVKIRGNWVRVKN